MQISRIYSNRPDEFTPIDFNCGDNSSILNVVYAEVKHPKDKAKDSHNLGKTTLLHLIDFLFLKNINGTEHFLAKHEELFSDYVFYIEFLLNNSSYVTIRRSVKDNTKISIKTHSEKKLTLLDEKEWDHEDLAIDRAISLLDGIFDLSALKHWSYRKGISYFLRSQYDYQDILQLRKFLQGPHSEWKPFVAQLLGYDPDPIRKKYELDKEIEAVISKRSEFQSNVQIDESDLTRLHTRIKINESQVKDIEKKLDLFDFSEEEKKITKELVQKIEKKSSYINNQLYNIKSDIQRLESSISTGIRFNIKDIQNIFEESEIALPEQLIRSYDELIDFNKKLSRERNSALKRQLKLLREKEDELSKQHADLGNERKKYLSVLRDLDTFQKYKALQKELVKYKSDLTYLKGQYEKLQQVVELSESVDKLERARKKQISRIKKMLLNGSEIYDNIAIMFNTYVKKVLEQEGEFYIKQNKNGNLEFNINIHTEELVDFPSSQGEGRTYKQIMCALFDLALLTAYKDLSFYRFVYHDGIFESLDDRKKLIYLDLIKEIVSGSNIQYIMSVIDSDLPRDHEGNKLEFVDDEIILKLHDDGPTGRLFKRPVF